MVLYREKGMAKRTVSPFGEKFGEEGIWAQNRAPFFQKEKSL